MYHFIFLAWVKMIISPINPIEPVCIPRTIKRTPRINNGLSAKAVNPPNLSITNNRVIPNTQDLSSRGTHARCLFAGICNDFGGKGTGEKPRQWLRLPRPSRYKGASDLGIGLCG